MTTVWQIIETKLVFISVAAEPLEEKEAMEEVNEVLVATAKAVADFADAAEEKSPGPRSATGSKRNSLYDVIHSFIPSLLHNEIILSGAERANAFFGF